MDFFHAQVSNYLEATSHAGNPHARSHQGTTSGTERQIQSKTYLKERKSDSEVRYWYNKLRRAPLLLFHEDATNTEIKTLWKSSSEKFRADFGHEEVASSSTANYSSRKYLFQVNQSQSKEPLNYHDRFRIESKADASARASTALDIEYIRNSGNLRTDGITPEFQSFTFGSSNAARNRPNHSEANSTATSVSGYSELRTSNPIPFRLSDES